MGVESIQSKLSMLMVTRADSVEKIVRTDADAAETLQVHEQVVLIDTATNAGTFTLTLPPVGEAAGKLYSITGISINGAVTVQDQDDAIDWTNITTIDTTLDGVLLYSDGLKWWTLASDLSH